MQNINKYYIINDTKITLAYVHMPAIFIYHEIYIKSNIFQIISCHIFKEYLRQKKNRIIDFR